ncbi:radical SAM protein [Desulfovibrio sp. OttesenSCG-928-A18]|nr:radical SAM protein [Desulfovibrio sp. OttesenSCG-928-A18]
MPDSASKNSPDPFADPALRGPGIWRSLRESFGGQRRILDVAQIEISSHCPGKCVYCPHTTMRGQWKAQHMEPECFVRLWPLLLQCARVHLQGWGEPLLHPRFLDMVALVRRAEAQVSTTSCGLVMNEELAKKLVRCGLDIIAFSLTGASAGSNNKARAGVDFARVLDAIRMLQGARKEAMAVHLEVHIAYLMLAGSMEEVLLLPELMAELGVHEAVVSTLDFIPAPSWEREAFAPEEEDKCAKARELLERAVSRARELGLALSYALPLPRPLASCLESPERSVFIGVQGTMSPCIYVNLPAEAPGLVRRVYGSVLREDPLDIWRKPEFAAFRAALASQEPDSACVRCPKRFALGNRSPCAQRQNSGIDRIF